MSNRRSFFTKLGALPAALFAGRTLSAQQMNATKVPVTTLDVADLPFTLDNGVKVFHLIAEPVKQMIIPGRTFDLWGFNGSAPGPTIQANEGDRVRIIFDNHLPESTGIHWHGLELPIEMDGVPGVGQMPVMPGERFIYEFPLHQNGTFFYHPHMAMQEMVGMLGGFIIHPKVAYTPQVDKDYLIALQEYAVLPNSTIPNSMSMEFNWLTFNGKSGPASTPLVIRHGERVRIRIINMGMDHHPIHLHGFTFWETGSEGARQQESAWTRGKTTLVGMAQARAEQKVERAEASLGLAQKAPIPDLQVTANLSNNYEPLESTRRPIGLQGEVQIGVQIPLFNRNQGNVAAAKGEIELAKQELVRLKLQLERELATMFYNYDSARITVQQYKLEMLPRAEKAYKLYQANYQNMAAAYPQALISQRTLFQLETDYIQALGHAWQSSLGISGYGFMDGLSRP